MFMKRSLSIVRNWILFAIQTIIPVLFLILVIIILSEMDGFRNLPKLIVRLERYVDPITVITRTTNNKYSETYMDYLEKTNKSFINWESQNLTMNIMEEVVYVLHVKNIRKNNVSRLILYLKLTIFILGTEKCVPSKYSIYHWGNF